MSRHLPISEEFWKIRKTKIVNFYKKIFWHKNTNFVATLQTNETQQLKTFLTQMPQISLGNMGRVHKLYKILTSNNCFQFFCEKRKHVIQKFPFVNWKVFLVIFVAPKWPCGSKCLIISLNLFTPSLYGTAHGPFDPPPKVPNRGCPYRGEHLPIKNDYNFIGVKRTFLGLRPSPL